jgi:hypothetical protein
MARTRSSLLTLAFLSLLSAAPALGAQAPAVATEASALAQANRQIVASVQSGIASGPQMRAALESRRGALETLLRSDPANAHAYTLPDAIRQAIAAADPSLAVLLEQTAPRTGELVASVADDFAHGTAQTRYTLHTPTSDTDLAFTSTDAQRDAHLSHLLHRQVTVHGIGLPSVMATDTLTAALPADCPAPLAARATPEVNAGSAAPATCSAFGQQRTAILFLTFPNNTPAFPSGTDSASLWTSIVTGPNPSVNGVWNEVSNGQTSASVDVFGPFALPQLYDCTTTSAMQTAALTAAASTVDFTQYNRIVLVFPVSSCSFGGLGNIGCQSANSIVNHEFSIVWFPIFSSYSTSFPNYWGGLSHELGHNLGMDHSNTLDFGSLSLGPIDFTATNPGTVTTAPPPIAPAPEAGSAPAPITAVNTEYGDNQAIMGYPWGSPAGYTGEDRGRTLGWIPATAIQEVNASGSFSLTPVEDASGTRLLHVLREPTTGAFLWLEFRQPIGFYTPADVAANNGTTITHGAVIRYDDPFLDSLHTYELDMTPVAVPNDFQDGTLEPGKSWSDPYSLLTLSIGTQTTSSLGVTVSYDQPCATLALSPSVLPAAAGSGTLTITAPSSCSWTVTSNASWITLSGTTAGSGNGTVTYTATANTSALQRNTFVTAQRQSKPLLQAGSGITIAGISPNGGSSAPNASAPFTLSYSDALGLSDLHQMNLSFGGSPGCFVAVVYSGTTAFGYLDTPTGFTSAQALGSAGNISAAGCTLSGTGSSYTTNGNSATLTLNLSFTSAYTGNHTISAFAYGNTSTNVIPLGYWIVSNSTTPATTLSITPGTLTFASTAIGATTAAQLVTIKNTGTTPVTFSASSSISGTGASSFIKTASTCTNPLPAGASCTNSIEFKPTVSGALTATLSYPDNATGSPQTVTLTGTGTSSTGPTLSITPGTLTFASTAIGATTAAQLVTIKNTGTTPVTFSASSSISGSGASSFIKTASTCTNPLPAGASCTNSIEFKPTAAGALTATLSYPDNATGSPQTVPLTGTGTSSSGPTLSITPGTLTFASTAIGATTAAQLITITNTGSTPVTFSASSSISGSGAGSFIKTASTCTNPLPAGASCTNSIEFKPTAAGALTAVISYPDNATGSPQKVTLNGTGH